MAFRDLFDIRKQFAFYGSYHDNPVNILIHLVCIWPILATTILFLQYTQTLISLDLPYCGTIRLNFSALLCMLYMVLYVIYDPVAGGLGAFGIAGIFIKSASLVAQDAHVLEMPIWKFAVGIHVAAWIAQFIGHGIFEGRAPALLDSLHQALLTAPLFVILEVLFFFGYKKELYASIRKEIDHNLKEFRREKKL